MSTSHPDKQVIDALGGATKVAQLLGLNGPNGAQRVHNWTTRGIPAAVKVQWPHIFMADALKEPV